MNAAFRFGRFELDARARELRKDGVRVRLQGQPFEVLLRLLQQPGDMITRDQLRQQLWPQGTFVDFEHGVNAAVKRLRAALGDAAERPRFIETLPRLGYRFIGAVERAGLDDVPGGFAGPDSRNSGTGTIQSPKRRLAVLPFTSRSGDVTQEYFAEGLREEMITQLGRLCGSRVGIIARTSSTLIQRTATRIRDIGDALRADYVVEGSVRHDGDRVRITVQLIESRGETQRWAESYERMLCDCFQVQSEVASEIVRSLAVALLPATAHVPQAGSQHAGAHHAYLKGRYHWNKPADQGLREAIAFFQQAIELDEQFAGAYAALGRAQVSAVNYQVVEPRAALANARRAASRALQLDPRDSEAHLTLAEVERILEWDWSGAEKGYRTALAFNPSSVAVHRHYGLYLAARRRVAEASASTDRAYDLDPLCLEVNTNAAWVRFVARDYLPGIERCRHTLDMDSGYLSARRLLAALLMAAGRPDEAAVELEWLAGQDDLDPISLAWLVHGLATKGERARAGEALEHLEQLARDRYVSAYHRSLAHLALDDHEGTLALLTLALEQRDPAIINLGVDPRFDCLASDRRYQAMVGRLALPD